MNVDALPDGDLMYRAVAARDPWYDGLVYFGVKTTGVFCRFPCPARTPRIDNVEYFTSADAARVAGYRACKRCAPVNPPAWVPTDFETLLRSPRTSAPRVTVRLTRVLSPLGVLVAGATDDGLCLLEFSDRRMLATQIRRLRQRLACSFAPGPAPPLDRLASELHAYFAGSLHSFSVPLLLPGPPFQQAVWSVLRAVPFGETRTYGQLAAAVGKPEAVRAVGRANGDNRVAILVPCHRILGADGSLRGYGGGLWRKRWLLELEARGRSASA